MTQATMERNATITDVDDKKEYIVWRGGRAFSRTLKEMTPKEREQQRQAEQRAFHVALFDIYN